MLLAQELFFNDGMTSNLISAFIEGKENLCSWARAPSAGGKSAQFVEWFFFFSGLTTVFFRNRPSGGERQTGKKENRPMPISLSFFLVL